MSLIRKILRPLRFTGLAFRLAVNDTRSRFNRTVLGPFWIVLSNMALVIGITVVFGGIFNRPIRDFVVYVSFGIATWSFISGVMTGSSNYLVSGRTLIFTFDIPWSLQVLRNVLSQMITYFIHIVLAIFVSFVALGMPSVWSPIIVIGVFINFLVACGLALIISTLGARFRDLSHAIASVMLFLFLFTPVFWEESALGETRNAIIQYNPLFHLLEIVRTPMLEGTVPWDSYLVSIIVAAVSLILGIFVYTRNRATISLWIQ